jgi:sugar/nucleoside kinase (ribokinase family)
MAMMLQKLLDSKNHQISLGLDDLEKSSGSSGIDARLVADILSKSHEVMRKLGLDTKDTTARELYHALNSQFKNSHIEDLLLACDYVLYLFENEVVSLNLIDIIENAHHELSFENRVCSHGQRALRGQVIERYMNSGRIDSVVAKNKLVKSGLVIDEDSEHHRHNVVAYRNSKNSMPYIVCIGDMVTDAFIKLDEKYAEVTVDRHGRRRLSMDFGSKPPYDEVEIINAVGNSANAAVAFAKFGIKSSLMAFCGDDQAGKDAVNYLRSVGVDTDLLSVQKNKKTNYHYALRYGSDRTILIKYEDYKYDFIKPNHEPDWIYLSMLSKSSWGLHKDLIGYLKKHPKVKLAFQPGTFHFEWGPKRLQEVYRRSYIVMMNKEESQDVTGEKTSSIQKLAKALHKLGPKIVIITDGPNGAFASDGSKIYAMPNFPDPKPPYDRTGAGDAFASTIVASLALGNSLETSMLWAPINSMSVVQKLGAQAGLLTEAQIKKYLKDAPKYYHPEASSL